MGDASLAGPLEASGSGPRRRARLPPQAAALLTYTIDPQEPGTRCHRSAGNLQRGVGDQGAVWPGWLGPAAACGVARLGPASAKRAGRRPEARCYGPVDRRRRPRTGAAPAARSGPPAKRAFSLTPSKRMGTPAVDGGAADGGGCQRRRGCGPPRPGRHGRRNHGRRLRRPATAAPGPAEGAAPPPWRKALLLSTVAQPVGFGAAGGMSWRKLWLRRRRRRAAVGGRRLVVLMKPRRSRPPEALFIIRYSVLKEGRKGARGPAEHPAAEGAAEGGEGSNVSKEMAPPALGGDVSNKK